MEKFDILIEAGQSNMVGYGHGPVKNPYAPDERVLFLTHGNPEDGDYIIDGDFDIHIAGERISPDLDSEDRLGSLSLTFAENYIKSGMLDPDRKLLIVRTALGSSGFMKHYWAIGDPLYERMLRMVDYAVSLNPDNRIMGLLWHQGEHEAAFLNDPQRYHDEFLAVVESIRQRYEKPQLPFICGGFCQEWAMEHQPACDNIMAVIRAVAAEMGGEYVETGDLRSNNQMTGDGDPIHFCREDLQELGRRYFAAFQKLN